LRKEGVHFIQDEMGYMLGFARNLKEGNWLFVKKKKKQLWQLWDKKSGTSVPQRGSALTELMWA